MFGERTEHDNLESAKTEERDTDTEYFKYEAF